MSKEITFADDFTDNPKIWTLDDSSFRLYVCAIAQCHRNKTAGRLSGEDVREALASSHANAVTVQKLVTSGLLVPDAEGYNVHDYAQDDSKAKRAENTQRKLEAQQVLKAWRESTGRREIKGSPADARRLEIIEARLKEFPVQDVMDAVRGWVNDEWEDRPRYNDIHQLIGRRGSSTLDLEKFRDLWRYPKIKRDFRGERKQAVEEFHVDPPPVVVERTPEEMEKINEIISEIGRKHRPEKVGGDNVQAGQRTNSGAGDEDRGTEGSSGVPDGAEEAVAAGHRS